MPDGIEYIVKVGDQFRIRGAVAVRSRPIDIDDVYARADGEIRELYGLARRRRTRQSPSVPSVPGTASLPTRSCRR